MSINCPDAIRAFRTTTTLLSKIPRRLRLEALSDSDEPGPSDSKDGPEDMARHRHLVLLVAFAILAVINHDVVAITAKQSKVDLDSSEVTYFFILNFHPTFLLILVYECHRHQERSH